MYVLPLSCKCTAGLYVPGVVFDGAQGEVFGDLCSRHTVLHILLIGKYQHSCFPQVLRGGHRTMRP